MHVTVCLAGQDVVEVEVGEDCRTLQALREAIAKELPQLCVEGFDVSVGGRALDDDEGVVSLEEGGVCLDVVANSRGLSVLALREAGREVSEAGLLHAAKSGDVSLCTLYLDAGVPIDCTNRHGSTPLFLSCQSGHVAVATLLLTRGSAAIDAKDHQGRTPLYCYSGQEVARLLIDRGCAIDEKTHTNSTPLHEASHRGDLEIVNLLLDKGSTAIDEKCDRGCTPLYFACLLGHLSVATTLLDRGSAAIDEKCAAGSTPLHGTCYHGYVGVATMLLDRGCAIDEKRGDGDTPLHHTCRNCHVEVVRLLLDRGSAAINEKNHDDHTPLHIACSVTWLTDFPRILQTVALLLDRGACFDVETYNLRTSPQIAFPPPGTPPRWAPYPQRVLEFLSERGYDVLQGASCAKRRRIGQQ